VNFDSDWAKIESRVYKFANQSCKNRNEIDDLVQTTRINAWKNYGRFNRNCCFLTWVLAIFRNVLRDHLRFVKRRVRLQSFDAKDDGCDDTYLALFGYDVLPRLMDAMDARDTLGSLPLRDEDIEMFTMLSEGWSGREVSFLMNKGREGVRTRVCRVRKQLEASA
jgi:RNA polymerase sigma factor (sigma-70 family)